VAATSDTWPLVRELPLTIESVAYERQAETFAYGFERVTTLVRLRGGGHEGLGEDVSPYQEEGYTLHVLAPSFPLEGTWTLESFCDQLASIDQWPVAPEWDPMKRWRNWAFESAALDLALAQAGMPLHEAVGRTPNPLRFVNSLGLGEPPTFDPIARRLDAHPELRFKLDVTPEWSPELMKRVADTGAVEIVDFKGHYPRDLGELVALLAMYERAIELFPDALLEDAHDLPEVAALLADAGDRISYDAPIHTAADLDTVPLAPRAVNIKPCRVGDLRSLFEVYDTVAARGMIVYGGGMGEVGVGRDQIQLLASLFHPDGPNDTAPSGYNADTPAASLPSSPLDPAPAPVGFRRAR
jgi:L-alanine-DL-glutamate epimerase-like enolase superfamily enzyme